MSRDQHSSQKIFDNFSGEHAMLIPDVLASVEFYSTLKGGRSIPTPVNFFGCIFVINNCNHDGRVLLKHFGQIFPGDIKNNVPIKFLCSDLVIPKLHIGTKFYIRDGKIIGEGVINEILNRNPEKTG